MTATDPRPGGSHRRVDRGRRQRVLMASLLVVILAAGGVEASLHWRGESKRPSNNAASSSYVSPSATPSGSTLGAPAPAGSSPAGSLTSSPPVTYPQSLTATPAPVTSASAAAPSSSAPPAATSSTPSPPPSTPASRPPVDILNSTHVAGMAARADTTLSHGGWIVALTGNYPKTLSVTTVFYPDGQLAAAQALAAQFTAIAKMAPAPDGVSTTDLTLVLATDWTSSGK